MLFLHRYALWFALPTGAALSLAFAPFDIWPLAILCPAFLFLVWQDAAPKRAAQLGFLFTSGTFLAGTYWLYNSVYVIGKAPLPIAIFLMLGLVAIMGAYMAVVGYCQARWLPKQGSARFLLALPAAWVLLEWIRGWLFSGFPWLAIGYTAIDTPLAAFAPLLGVYGVSWVLAAMAGAVAAIAVRVASSSYNLQPTAYSLLILPWLIAYPLWHRDWTTPIGAPISVAIVQGAVPQEMKWTQAQHDSTLQLYRDLTLPHLGTQLIVWPESALPDWAEELGGFYTPLWRQARERGTDLVVGQQTFDAKTRKAYNGVLALSDRPQWYYKHHLVPFGEYFPVPAFVRQWMRMMSLPHSDFSSGAANQPPLQAAGQKIAVTVCYEDAYGSSQLAVLREATLLVNVTNDAWFGDSTARHQHLQISRMRALEAGRPLLRAANDGISGILNAQGLVVSRLASFKSGVLTGFVQPRSGLTPYARVGNWLVTMGCLAVLAIAYIRRNRLLPVASSQ